MISSQELVQTVLPVSTPIKAQTQITDDAPFTNLFDDVALVKVHLDCLGLNYEANNIIDLLLQYNNADRVNSVVNRILDEPSNVGTPTVSSEKSAGPVSGGRKTTTGTTTPPVEILGEVIKIDSDEDDTSDVSEILKLADSIGNNSSNKTNRINENIEVDFPTAAKRKASVTGSEASTSDLSLSAPKSKTSNAVIEIESDSDSESKALPKNLTIPQSLAYLKDRYQLIPAKTVRNTFKMEKYNLKQACIQLDAHQGKFLKTRRKSRKSDGAPKKLGDFPVLANTLQGPSQNQTSHVDSSTTLVELLPDDEEFLMVQKKMLSSVKPHAYLGGAVPSFKIIRVQKLQNPKLWNRYCRRREEVSEENNNNPNERMLFHGSRAATNEIIQKGFDERFANNGMFGAGIYFADNSSKSHGYVGLNAALGYPGHQTQKNKPHLNLFLCRVTLGKSHSGRMANNMMAHAPPGHHSVTGNRSAGLNFAEYIIYRGEQAYPEYLITYQ